MAAASEYPGKLVSAASIASPFQADITDAINRRKGKGKAIPKLIGILATPSPPSVAYAEWTKKACEQVGIEFEIWKTWYEKSTNDDRGDGSSSLMEGIEGQRPDTDLEADVEDLIIAANADDNIHGIMVYYPIFGGRQDTYLQQILDPRKDVEGLHFSYCWNMYHNVRWILPDQLGGAPGTTMEANDQVMGTQMEERIPAGHAKSILPCTPLAVVKCLESMGVYDLHLPYGDRLYGKVITVINRSEVVGRPLAALLSNDGAKVFSIDLDSVQEFNKRATIEKDRRPSEAVTRAREKNSQRKLRSHHIVRPCPMTMQQCIEASDVVISGVPSPNFKIQTDWIKSGAVTVNFSSEKNFEKDVRRRASKHLPAIGKTTIAMLQRNLLRLVEYKEMGQGVQRGMDFDDNGGGGNGGNDDDDDHDDASGNGRGKGDSRYNGHNSNRAPLASDISQTNTSVPSKEASGADNTRQASHMLTCAADDTALFAQPDRASKGGLGAAFVCRNRSNTVTLPPTRSDQANLRTVSHPATLQQSEWTYPNHRSSIASTTTSASSCWDWRHGYDSRRASVVSGVTTIASRESPSPGSTKAKSNIITLPSLSQASPLIFGPASPFGASASTSSSRGSAYTSTSQSLLEKANSISSPRSATPISPLLMDHLSVDDAHYPLSTSAPSTWDAHAHRFATAAHLSVDGSMKEMPPRLYQPFPSPADAVMTAASPSRDDTSSNTSDRIVQNRRRRRPPFSYSSLIAQAISSSPEGRMTLREIYTWISNAYPDLYSMDGNEGSGWQNTVRHNLSLNKCFVKVARTAKDIYESCSSGIPSQSQAARGKGGWWTLDHTMAQAQLGNFYRRDSLGSEGSTGGNTPIAASYTEDLHGRSMSIPASSPSVLQSAPNTFYSSGYTRPFVEVNQMPPFHPQRTMSVTDASGNRHPFPLVSARRSSVSSNQHSTIKRKLPFATPSHRHGSEVEEMKPSSSSTKALSLQRPQIYSQQNESSYQQKNSRHEPQDSHRSNNQHVPQGSALYTPITTIPLVSSSSQRSTAMQVDDDATTSKNVAINEAAKPSGKLAINELLNS